MHALPSALQSAIVVSLVHTSHGLDSAAKVQMVRMCSDLVEAELGFA